MLTTLAALLAAAASACASPQFLPHEGALRITATDLVVGGSRLAVRRGLTTSLPFAGQFGVGFGIEEELRVEPLAGGAVRVTVPGPCPACAAAVPEPSPEALLASVTLAARTLRASGVSLLAGEASAYAAALAADPRWRREEWAARNEAWLAAARLEPADGLERLPVAARHRVVALPSGYLRFSDATLVQELDAEGRLRQVVDAAGLVTRVHRDAAGRIVRLEDGRGRAITFELDAAGLTVAARGSDGAHASYGYDGAGRMTWSEGKEGRATYTWGADGALVGLQEGRRTATFTYEPRSAGGRVTSFADSYAGEERYAYEGRAGGFSRAVTVYAVEPDHAGAGVTRRGALREVRRHAYVEPLTVDGRRWTWQETVEEDDEVSVRTYDARTFQPLVVAEGERVARFEYDDLGRVVRKEVAGEVTALTYGEDGKVAAVERRGGERGPGGERITYLYDDAGHLLTVSAEAASAQVEYDAVGRIAVVTTMKEGATRRLTFAYDASDKPRRIEAAGLGGITVSYGPDGDIQKVDSEGGRKVALEVTSAFQVLLELVRPAGVRLDAG